MISEYNIFFYKNEKPFRSFYSTWSTHVYYEHKTALYVIGELKKHPYITNIQYRKIKNSTLNSITVSFKTEADEAPFLLYSNNGIRITPKDL